MNCVKTILTNTTRGEVTAFHVDAAALKASEIPLEKFLAEHQNPNDRFPTFPFQIEDDDYSLMLLWPEELYAAFRLTRLPITLDAISAWLQFHDVETAEGIHYQIIEDSPEDASPARAGQPDTSEFLKRCDAFAANPANFEREQITDRQAASDHLGDALVSLCEAHGFIASCGNGLEEGQISNIVSLLESFVNKFDAPATPFDALFQNSETEKVLTAENGVFKSNVSQNLQTPFLAPW